MASESMRYIEKIDSEKVKRNNIKLRSFEEGMVVAESYRQAMFNEMGLLYLDFAIELIKSKPELSEKYAKQSIEFLEKKIKLTSHEETAILEKLRADFDLIAKKQYDKLNIEEVKKEIETLNKFMNNEQKLVLAREGYYKTFKQY